MRINYDGGGPRPSDKVKVGGGGGGGGGERDIQTPGERGPGFQKKYFRPFGPQLGNNKGRGGRPLPWVRQ